ncbi:MAG: GNAT family N-acetyltransferase, partial [Sporomusa sp.]
RSELHMWGGLIDSKLVGVIATFPCDHICLLFVDKAYHRQGIARTLFNRMLDYYKTSGGCSAITVNSSPYAVGAYQRLGLIATDSEQTVNGIRFIPMKRLVSFPGA